MAGAGAGYTTQLPPLRPTFLTFDSRTQGAQFTIRPAIPTSPFTTILNSMPNDIASNMSSLGLARKSPTRNGPQGSPEPILS